MYVPIIPLVYIKCKLGYIYREFMGSTYTGKVFLSYFTSCISPVPKLGSFLIIPVFHIHVYILNKHCNFFGVQLLQCTNLCMFYFCRNPPYQFLCSFALKPDYWNHMIRAISKFSIRQYV